ncbi:2-hydroxymuconic semialdehyde dehydrogenase [Pseudomonas agarici]|uniref:2-hydroxymuconic semialdehyde dehydrogenase n=1 Tax=Pseudomonas agarici TaxID=46677 RepID=UPI0006843C26|nr:2-hydroxymuconic semialdehyde dehydrogenase [Pseudomonas agarici]NWC09258.1 2-hydroxymuconic semialdehyde dehydrogenase [Pseudomonas agarici]SEK30214.1 aminomuconate-semialdehyde/2-hydroxymuconate-6-semialdehyde dehydrogenase [Pseudomonas agarici]
MSTLPNQVWRAEFAGVPSQLLNYIDGNFVTSATSFANINPVNGKLISNVFEADAKQVDEAVIAARNALKGPWGKLSVESRAALIHKIADGIEARFEEFVAAEVADTGRPVHQARTLDIPRAIANFRTFADLAKTSHTDLFEMSTADGAGALNYTVRKPLGVIGVISPWNLPLLLFTWKVAPALACGNVVVAKPSEESPSSATLLAEVMHDAGVPPGVFNLIHGFGKDSAGEFLTRHPGISALTFTGESKTGATIMKAVADGVKEVSFELGGKNAAVVFADADMDAAIAGVLRSSFTNSGQVCLCSERVYVHRSIFDEFVSRLKVETERLVVGYPDQDGVSMGPLISHGHRDKVLSYYRLAVEEGATVVTGGGIPIFNDERDQGAYVQPTIWTGLSDKARCVTEEIFGPVCHISPFDEEDEVINRVNDSDYGLACAIWTTHLSRAHRVSRQIHVGLVWVNTWYLRDLRTPFGGVKLSGLGREGGRFSMDFYSDIANICIKI